ncbi:hypothetical protein SNOG_03592 [Parastagonospora nodorum SN15]|uniref:Uncharacterized protein n=1 Tax=Phaeosphaeria nodorum (strain SN15 / ATCC MYA-4574 / FGSC 10173) TaxID=321614 RepID=Q0UXC2_PHANO|nr:hypothetical protein SNOG_03592 [Parastagonospora nodorum SN15]EAT88797.1 hypothetical protein SNOG_03592 [Parastagonospora nodorum SN15]
MASNRSSMQMQKHTSESRWIATSKIETFRIGYIERHTSSPKRRRSANRVSFLSETINYHDSNNERSQTSLADTGTA